MADPIVEISEATPRAEDAPTSAADVDMGGAGEDEKVDGFDETMPGVGLPEEQKRTTFLDYLRSPIVELVVGSGEDRTVLAAHEGLLIKSPYFANQCATFADGSVPRRIMLPDEDIDAIGSFLEYLYMDEYFPRRAMDGKELERDPTIPEADDSGCALLRHARVYTLADKFGMPQLKSLAHSKIHRTESTARGEIAYARYVYKEMSKEDITIRRPVAAFWATRSHVLRHQAEDDFRAMCLEFPQFGFDVLSLVLDQREKRSAAPEKHHGELATTPGERSVRKRARHI
ncbi:hypothetical protein BDY21DRAFT_387236 [Lineolata rhizophorae]|uniref:BTB domain-containing protein n=1 Tax=Lineolata rhizophorae TaxID=578093 RepID=A0A6A6NTR7_9PEZI|nr:hypothetical protein BDY21DRAFT_387236 [Lineolata rhizophorae]